MTSIGADDDERATALNRSPTLGRPIAYGSRSTVHAWGNDAVAKVPVDRTPDHWIRSEADFSTAVRLVGAPVPEFLGFAEHDGRVVSLYRRAVGVLMWDAIVETPAAVGQHGRRLVELQVLLAGLVPPVGLPRQADRLTSKIRLAARRVDPDLDAARSALPPPQREVMCHGDMHPGNVILTADGPMVVDWFDAARGDPLGDVARTAVLLTGASGTDHLAGARTDLLDRVQSAYLDAAGEAFDFGAELLDRWRAVVTVARIAEGVAPEGLRAVWSNWLRSVSAARPNDAGDRTPHWLRP